MLSAEELMHHGSKEAKLPETGGIKYYGPEESDEQKTSVKKALDQYHQILHEERICRKSNLSVAHWEQSNCLAVVTVRKGSSFHKFGHETKEGLFLHPEEALFLLDQGLLQLKHDNFPLSLEEAYILLIPILSSLEHYQVYSHLCKLGFVVTRFKKSGSTSRSSNCKWGTLRESSTHSKVKDTDASYRSLEPMASGHAKELWTKDQYPLVRPGEATSTTSVLSKLQVNEQKHLKEVSNDVSLSACATTYNIDFDVYVGKDLKKSDLGMPNFTITVCRYCEPPPSLLEISILSRMSEGAHLKLAVVEQGTVSFYGMFGVDLPTLVFKDNSLST